MTMAFADIRPRVVAATPATLMPRSPRVRDIRVDVLRGAALFMIFVDHIPGDLLNFVTLHNFGFCDAAEVFVMLAGFSSMMAYGAKFDREGITGATLRKIAARCLKIYLVQAALLFATMFIVWGWSARFGLPPTELAPTIEQGADGLVRALTLRSLPGFVDILPLYIVLLAAFPLIYMAMRRHIGIGLGVSALVWGVANLDHRLNLPNSLDGNGWYFNPFTWQFLFTTGAAVAVMMARRGDGLLPRKTWLAALCWAYLAFAFLQGATWADWHLPNMQLFPMGPPDKSHLSPLRVLDVMALLYLFISSRSVSRILRGSAVGVLALCGRHSLEVFAVGCTGALLARLLVHAYGTGLWMQIGVNGVGMGAMCAVAVILEQRRVRQKGLILVKPSPRRDVRFQQERYVVYRA